MLAPIWLSSQLEETALASTDRMRTFPMLFILKIGVKVPENVLRAISTLIPHLNQKEAMLISDSGLGLP